MKIRLSAKNENLSKLLAACENYLFSEFSAASHLLFMAIEEAFVNIASYAYENKNGYVDFEILRTDDNRVRVTFTDSGVPFDPIHFNDDETAKKHIDNLIPGGLGIALIKHAMENLKYEYTNGNNVFSFETVLEKRK